MGIKQAALAELEAAIIEFDINPSRMGRDIFGDPSFMRRFREDRRRVSDKTLDSVFRYILSLRGQLELDLELENGEDT